MEKGKVTHSPLFIMRAIQYKEQAIQQDRAKQVRSKEKGGNCVKIAAVAPKKVAPTAVLRNAIRRRAYEAVLSMIPSIIPGTHAIIFAKPESIRADLKGISADLKTLFSKAKISV